jgi:heme A synthase
VPGSPYTIPQFLHNGLSRTATLFLLALGIWAIIQFLRNKPLGPSWYGAAVVAQILLVVQGLLGAWMYLFGGQGALLARPFIHILYGIVAIIALPSAWGYFSNLNEERVQSLAMGLTCIFLWGIVLRSIGTAPNIIP